jgi:PAS domain S-box-containing protein
MDTNPPQRYERRYRALADAMPQMVWAADAYGRHFYYNQRWYAYTGLSEAESLGLDFATALHPDDRERTLDSWEQAWRAGTSYEVEHRFRRHDGIYYWFISRSTPLTDTSGAIVEWAGTCTNIDEQKRANEMLRFLAEASTLLSATHDYRSALRQMVNLAVPLIADWCAVDLLDPDIGTQRLAVAHSDPARIAQVKELARRMPRSATPDRGVARVLRTGQPELIEAITPELVRATVTDPVIQEQVLALGLRSAMIVPLLVRGSCVGAITFATADSRRALSRNDLSMAEDLAHRAATALDSATLYRELVQIKQTLDQTHDCVFMFAPDTLRFFYVNHGAIEQVGYSQEELLEMTPLDITPEYDEARFRAMVAPLLAGTRTLHTFETTHRHKNGHLVPVDIALQYMGSDGARGRFVAVVRDITERRRAAAALEERNRELDQFAYVASHDLKAPLRGIANLAQWIEEDLADQIGPETRGYLELMRGRVRRMEGLINGLLQYSRVGRSEAPVALVDVTELLHEVTDLLAPPLGVRITIHGELPTLQTSRLLLHQVFANLIENALKHGRRPDLTITISAQRAGPIYTFCVADDGQGIAPRYHERIFGIFQTLAAPDSVERSGLGLALIKKIVEHQGGRIWIDSDEGRGAAFSFTWPVHPRKA